ncbi:hypothetical protein B9Z55_008888 [Caenorhabditis nigoni]|uniref:Uncharacterized protein n=1 Tax=Caenorhabditis nigoni TaxID=1611254 RepID=A0A2G5UQ60_9PELO|nr:hypothetical protein B9Z55_008888 [Caenorhabditis nigoni]
MSFNGLDLKEITPGIFKTDTVFKRTEERSFGFGTPIYSPIRKRSPLRSKSSTSANMGDANHEDYKVSDADKDLLIKTGSKSVWKDTGDIIRLLEKHTKKFGKAADLKQLFHELARLMYRLNVPSEIGVPLLPFFLSNPALEKYNTISSDAKMDWGEVTKEMLKLHECEADKELALEELDALVQGSSTVKSHMVVLGIVLFFVIYIFLNKFVTI